MSESTEQQALFSWAALQQGKYPCLGMMFHIPNERKCSAATGARLKREGVKAGIPDIFLPHACGGYHGLFIELKAGKGRPSKAQLEKIEALTQAGYMARWCVGWEAAARLVLEYVKGEAK